VGLCLKQGKKQPEDLTVTAGKGQEETPGVRRRREEGVASNANSLLQARKIYEEGEDSLGQKISLTETEVQDARIEGFGIKGIPNVAESLLRDARRL